MTTTTRCECGASSTVSDRSSRIGANGVTEAFYTVRRPIAGTGNVCHTITTTTQQYIVYVIICQYGSNNAPTDRQTEQLRGKGERKSDPDLVEYEHRIAHSFLSVYVVNGGGATVCTRPQFLGLSDILLFPLRKFGGNSWTKKSHFKGCFLPLHRWPNTSSYEQTYEGLVKCFVTCLDFFN